MIEIGSSCSGGGGLLSLMYIMESGRVVCYSRHRGHIEVNAGVI